MSRKVASVRPTVWGNVLDGGRDADSPISDGGTFEPEHIAAMSLAFQEVCEALEIGPRATREREVIAVRIIELARRGEQSPRRLISRVLEEAGVGDPTERRSA
jgi:hypothetical protein